MEYRKIKNKKKRLLTGFTLIELLVVVAIIGILASVLLVNLSSSRQKSNDSAIKSEMNQIRTAMEYFNIINDTYSGGCATGTDCDNIQNSIKAKLPSGASGEVEGFPISGANFGKKYCVRYILNSGTQWCVDSSGFVGTPTFTCGVSIVNGGRCR